MKKRTDDDLRAENKILREKLRQLENRKMASVRHDERKRFARQLRRYGMSLQAIADIMLISEGTVNSYVYGGVVR